MPVSFDPRDATCGRPLNLFLPKYHQMRIDSRKPGDPPAPRRKVRDMPGLLEPVIHRMATSEEHANLSQTYAGIIACGVFVFENFESCVKWSRAKKSAGNLTNIEQTFLYDPNVITIRSPLLLDRPRVVTVTINPETAERLEELGEVWSVSQAALLRSAIIAGISQDRGFVDESLVDICIFETKWLDKHLSQELEVRMQLIELTRQYDSESAGH